MAKDKGKRDNDDKDPGESKYDNVAKKQPPGLMSKSSSAPGGSVEGNQNKNQFKDKKKNG